MQDCVMFKAGRNITKEKPKSSIEETDSRLIQHLIEAKRESQRVVVISNDTDVVAYCLTYKIGVDFMDAKKYVFVLEQETKPEIFPFMLWQINWRSFIIFNHSSNTCAYSV